MEEMVLVDILMELLEMQLVVVVAVVPAVLDQILVGLHLMLDMVVLEFNFQQHLEIQILQ